MSRLNITSGAPWEEQTGYCRAVRIGNTVEVSGTVSIKNGEVFGKGDAYVQTKQILTIIENALKEAGASITDVIRTRMYLTNIEDWPQVTKAHGEVFRSIKPASTLVAINQLISPEFLVEIEATAVV